LQEAEEFRQIIVGLLVTPGTSIRDIFQQWHNDGDDLAKEMAQRRAEVTPAIRAELVPVVRAEVAVAVREETIVAIANGSLRDPRVQPAAVAGEAGEINP
jgi:hypothetical protein